jgi:uncharacterized protein (TIGR03437 family)
MLQGQTSSGPPIVRFHTNLGDIDVQLLPNFAPNTVANFLAYMNAGAYTNSIIHRSVPGFIWQGGGYQLEDGSLVAIPANAAINNEFAVSNTAGTLAMALSGTNIDSATTEWFFNETDNSSSLDSQFFTVFGEINSSDTASFNVLNSIATVPVYTSTPLGSLFDQIPLLNYSGSGTIASADYVLVESIGIIQPHPIITTNGVITASAFGGYPAAAPGSYIEIYGAYLAGTTRDWATSDFSGGNAPTSLDNVSVTIDGFPAYVSYVSPTQVNVQVPAGVSPTLHEATVALTYNNEATLSTVMLAIRPYEGGLLAPSTYKVGGTQYVAAFHANGTPVSNGKIPGTAAAPAMPGETLVFYGVGFGPVTPSSVPVAGVIAEGQTSLATTPFQFMIGNTQADVAYAGFAPGYVGLYQFNVVVPDNAPSGDLPIAVTLGQETVPQTLYLTVQ